MNVYLIEWQTKSGWSELGIGQWEVDHNGGIWFNEKSAKEAMNRRLSNPEFKRVYKMRVSRFVPANEAT